MRRGKKTETTTVLPFATQLSLEARNSHLQTQKKGAQSPSTKVSVSVTLLPGTQTRTLARWQGVEERNQSIHVAWQIVATVTTTVAAAKVNNHHFLFWHHVLLRLLSPSVEVVLYLIDDLIVFAACFGVH